MFRKIVAFLAFASFLASSEMSLVHACGTRSVPDTDIAIHAKESVVDHVSCETAHANGKGIPECLKAVSQEIAIPATSQTEGGGTGKSLKFAVQPVTFMALRTPEDFAKPPPTEPLRADTGSYASLVGIVKRLD